MRVAPKELSQVLLDVFSDERMLLKGMWNSILIMDPPSFTKVYSPNMKCEQITTRDTPCSNKGVLLNLDDGLRYCRNHANGLCKKNKITDKVY